VGRHLALNSRGSIDPRWLTHSQRVLYALELAQIEIFEPTTATQVYNPTTNTWTVTSDKVYTGPARIQPIMTAGNEGEDYNPSLFQNVKIQISKGRNTLAGSSGVIPDIRSNYQIRVTSAPYNSTLEKFVFVVTSVLNSSNAWERTLLCKVDIELDPTITGA
jgi:hypothetical protein